jgi:outer membrane receptor protein involved in Fe transport
LQVLKIIQLIHKQLTMLLKSTTVRLWLATCLFLISSVATAQQKTVSGRIIGDDGKPIAGATISAKGSNAATQTNEEGAFSLSIPNNSNTLVISSVGFQQQEVTIGSQSSFNVSLKTLTSSLSEVVVTGYSTQRRKDITGSVAVVDVNSLRQIPTGSVAQSLQGKAAGVTVLSSGQPGGAVNVLVRGITSTGMHSH